MAALLYRNNAGLIGKREGRKEIPFCIFLLQYDKFMEP
jgi:hypothetical protein